jgi:hypothetical protein
MCTQYLHHIHPPSPFANLLSPSHWYQLPPTSRTYFTLLFSGFCIE